MDKLTIFVFSSRHDNKIDNDYDSCRSERSEKRATAEEERSDSVVTGVVNAFFFYLSAFVLLFIFFL